MATRSKWVLISLVLCIALGGTCLRLYHLGSSALWFDELVSVELATAKGGLSGIWQGIVRWRYPHPPLFIFILHLTLQVFRVSEFTARIIPAFSGILAIFLLYRYISEFTTRRAALLGAGLLAFSPYHIFYSQEARPYALSFSLAIVTWLVLRKALLGGKVKWWLAHTVCLVSLLYLHYFNACAIVGESLYVLLFWHRQKRRLGGFILSGMAAFLLSLPVLLNARSGTVVLNRTFANISLLEALMTIAVGETRYVADWARETGFMVFALLTVVGVFGLRKRLDVLAMNLLPLLSAFLFIFVVLKAVGYVVPPYEERQFMVVFPFLLTLAASGGEYLLGTGVLSRNTTIRFDFATVQSWLRFGRQAFLVLCMLVILIVDVVALHQYYFHFVKNADIKVAEHIGALALPGDIVVCNSYSVATTLNFYGSAVPEYVTRARLTQGGWEFSEQLAIVPDEEIRWTKTLADVLNHRRIWLVYLEGQGPEELTRELLENTTPVSEQNIGPFTVWLLSP